MKPNLCYFAKRENLFNLDLKFQLKISDMKKTLYLLVMLFTSCTIIDDSTELYNIPHNQIIDEAYSFEAITAKDVWSTHNTIEEMQEACQIPDDYLKCMTTRSLVETCMKYPLFGNYLAYNDQFEGIMQVMSGFNGFKELRSRSDAAEELLKYYASMDVESINAQTKSEAYSNIVQGNSVIHFDYIELVLMSGAYSSIDTEDIEELRFIAEEKLQNKINSQGLFGYESIYKTGIIIDCAKSISNTICKSDGYVVDTTYWFNKFKDNYYNDNGSIATNGVYTKEGQYIEVLNRSNLTEAEILTRQQYLVHMYPNAIILSPASSRYNGHAYAWHMSDGGEECWINATTDDSPQLVNSNIKNYWTNDYYWQTHDPLFAQKILYISGSSTHSATRSNVVGKYESKWGDLPLVRHAPDYCPYQGTKLYFTHNATTGLLVCSSGNGETSVGESNNYYPAQELTSEVSYRDWEILTAKGTDAVEDGKANIYTNGNVATISFNYPGLYQIFYRSYNSRNYLIGEYFFEPIVE